MLGLMVDVERIKHDPKLTRKDLAAKLGVTEPTLRSWLKNITIPADKLIILSELFDCSTDYLLGIRKSENNTFSI